MEMGILMTAVTMFGMVVLAIHEASTGEPASAEETIESYDFPKAA